MLTLVLGVLAAAGAAAVAWLATMGAGAFRVRRRMQRRVAMFAAVLEPDELRIKPVLAFEETVRRRDLSLLVLMLQQMYPLSGGVRTGIMALGVAVGSCALTTSLLQFFGAPPWLGWLAGLALGALAGWSFGAMREDARRVLFGARLLGTVEEFHRLSRHGMSTGQAFDSVVALAEEPVRSSMRRVQTAGNLGVPLAAALGAEAQRLKSSDLAMLAAIFATQSHTGGGITESVGNLANMLRERQDNRSRMKAAAAEPKITLYIVSCVPFAAIAIQVINQPDIIELLLGPARHLLAIGGALILTGLVVAWLIVRSVQR